MFYISFSPTVWCSVQRYTFDLTLNCMFDMNRLKQRLHFISYGKHVKLKDHVLICLHPLLSPCYFQ